MTPLLPVHVDGAHLKTSDGKPFKAIGVADFSQFKRFLWPGVNGWEVLVKPILVERRNLARAAGYDGPLVARVFRYAAGWNAFSLDPWSYPMTKVTEFMHRMADEGWYVDWTCGDSQAVLPDQGGPRGQQEHLNQFCAALVGCDNALNVQTSNEDFKNGIDVGVVRPPKWGTYLTNSGYYRDSADWNHSYDLDVINFHTDRGDDMDHSVPKFVGKLFETAVYLAPLGKPIIYDEIIGADERDIPGKRCNRPDLWAQMGLSLGLVDGLYFHSTPGLSSDGFGPVVQECFKGFIRGARAALSI